MDDFERKPVLVSDDLLTTKLTPPRLRGALVPRSSLLVRLDEGIAHKLTLISAPAGFGKTTLISPWIAEREHPVAWVTLDAGDNDPTRVWRYVITAHRTVIEWHTEYNPGGNTKTGCKSWAMLKNIFRRISWRITQNIIHSY